MPKQEWVCRSEKTGKVLASESEDYFRDLDDAIQYYHGFTEHYTVALEDVKTRKAVVKNKKKKHTKLEIELYEALSQLIDRLDEHGSIDLVREEGPIQDARDAILEFETGKI